ncbi:radical SAM family heme chaperone HemW [Zooshikella marina]|uniref:radical SAM family heme chaperone HemW n=1 Tax=Zooshikella ganghwensis TaxID=202772 RepID=UPI001BAE86EC|nr:radical SAM family heme chaperone HemW [Zooshikella ganghwensis]MBU2707822.1 radical SAM family heme chaperone HemW [Zooshikella ganghwensis]
MPLQLPPLSLYIHIPWCIKKCPYCDFNSHTAQDTLPEKEYCSALLDDLMADLHLVQGRPLQSIFIGGGTPSLFSAKSFNHLLKEIQQKIPFADDIEITLEANPGTFEQAKFSGYFQTGINRLSIGVQSFQPKQLQQLGRIHNTQEASRAIDMAKKAGFTNFNIDLMFGLPEQTLDDALFDLNQAVSLSPTHISWYQLTIEPNTIFFSKPPKLPDDDSLFTIQQAGQRRLHDAGFQQYEISAYAQENCKSKHNMNYWEFGDYLGIGAGAHSKITFPDQNKIHRFWKTRIPKDYLDLSKSYLAGKREIHPEERALEFLMNTLRLNNGVPSHYFLDRTGESLQSIYNQLDSAQKQALLMPFSNQLQATPKGLLYLNTLLEKFM